MQLSKQTLTRSHPVQPAFTNLLGIDLKCLLSANTPYKPVAVRSHGFEPFIRIDTQSMQNCWQMRINYASFILSDGTTCPVDELKIIRQSKWDTVLAELRLRFQRLQPSLLIAACLPLPDTFLD